MKIERSADYDETTENLHADLLASYAEAHNGTTNCYTSEDGALVVKVAGRKFEVRLWEIL